MISSLSEKQENLKASIDALVEQQTAYARSTEIPRGKIILSSCAVCDVSFWVLWVSFFFVPSTEMILYYHYLSIEKSLRFSFYDHFILWLIYKQNIKRDLSRLQSDLDDVDHRKLAKNDVDTLDWLQDQCIEVLFLIETLFVCE